MFRVVFVCMGNICRSPTAHGVFRSKLQAAGLTDRILVESAGTHNYHPGEAPDPRSQAHAKKRGYDLSDLRAKQLHREFIKTADLILVMDWDNLSLVQAQCEHDDLPEHARKVRRFTEFCTRHDAAVVPDPYYGGAQGFEHVLDLVEDASDGLLLFARKMVNA
jgi:protein-tyrosine phosphatase